MIRFTHNTSLNIIQALVSILFTHIHLFWWVHNQNVTEASEIHSLICYGCYVPITLQILVVEVNRDIDPYKNEFNLVLRCCSLGCCVQHGELAIGKPRVSPLLSLNTSIGCNTVFDMRLRVTFLRRKTVSLQSNIAHRE